MESLDVSNGESVVDQLIRIAAARRRKYVSSIQAVVVLGGPGTYYAKLNAHQPEWMRWADRDRIRAGVALTRELTAIKKSDFNGVKYRPSSITKGDIMEFGPLYVYDADPHGSETFMRTLDSPKSKLPKEKVLVIDHYEKDNQSVPISNTRDNFTGLYQQLSNPQSPLHKVSTLAIVSHIPHFHRIPLYIAKCEKDFKKLLNREMNYWFYGIMPRKGTYEKYDKWEKERVDRYIEKGDLERGAISFTV